MTEQQFRASEARRKAHKNWLESDIGAAVVSILQSGAQVDAGKGMGASSEMSLLALAEYSTLLGRQQQVNLLRRLAEPPPEKVSTDAPLLGTYREELLPPKFHFQSSSTTA